MRLEQLVRQIDISQGHPHDRPLVEAADYVASLFKANGRYLVQVAWHFLGDGPGPDLEDDGAPELANVRALLEREGGRAIGGPRLHPPAAPPGLRVDPRPSRCVRCGGRVWWGRPLPGSTTPTVALEECGQPHVCTTA